MLSKLGLIIGLDMEPVPEPLWTDAWWRHTIDIAIVWYCYGRPDRSTVLRHVKANCTCSKWSPSNARASSPWRYVMYHMTFLCGKGVQALIILRHTAPVPRFDVHTMDALIKKPQQPPTVPSNDNPNWQGSVMPQHQSIPNGADSTWWAQQQQQPSQNQQDQYLPPPSMERPNAPGPIPALPSSRFSQQHVPQPLSQYGFNGYANPALSPNNVSPPQPPFTNSSDGAGMTSYMPPKRYSAMMTPSDMSFQTYASPSDGSIHPQQPFGRPSPPAPGWIETQMSWQTTPNPQDGQPSWQPDAGDHRSWVPEVMPYNQQPLWHNTDAPPLPNNPEEMLHVEAERKPPQPTGQYGKTVYSHGRSRSVPHASTNSPLLPMLNEPLLMSKPHTASEIDDMQSHGPYSPTSIFRSQQRPAAMHRASMDPDSFQKLLTKIDRGESLLLTKGLDFDSGKSLNPFRRSATISHSSRRRVPSMDDDNPEGPFADQASSTPVRRESRIRSESLSKAFDDAIPDNLSFVHPNARRNKFNLSPPPIPSQLTKPSSLKYARNRFG